MFSLKPVRSGPGRMEIPRLSTWPVIGKVAWGDFFAPMMDRSKSDEGYIWIPTNLPYKITQNVGKYTVGPMDSLGVA